MVAKQVKAGLKAQNEAAEIKLRAERRAGEMLAQIKRMTPQESAQNATNVRLGRREDSNPLDESYTSVVESNDIEPRTAYNWQRIAEIPEARRSTMAEPV